MLRNVGEPERDDSRLTPLGGRERAAALVWVVVVVGLFLAVQIGVTVVR